MWPLPDVNVHFKCQKKFCNSLCADTTLPIKCQSKATMELICGSHHCTQPITPRKPLSCGRNRLMWVGCHACDPNPACIISTGLEHRQSLLSISIGQIPEAEGENLPDDQLQKTGTRIPSLAEEVGWGRRDTKRMALKPPHINAPSTWGEGFLRAWVDR